MVAGPLRRRRSRRLYRQRTNELLISALGVRRNALEEEVAETLQ